MAYQVITLSISHQILSNTSLIIKNLKIYLGSFHILNEIVIDRGPSPFLAVIDLECDQQYLTTVQGDGIIVATPTGAYLLTLYVLTFTVRTFQTLETHKIKK